MFSIHKITRQQVHEAPAIPSTAPCSTAPYKWRVNEVGASRFVMCATVSVLQYAMHFELELRAIGALARM